MGIFEDIRGIIAEETQVPVDQVKENSNFESDLKADSLTQVELVMELAPLGVLALMAGTVSTFGLDVLWRLALFIAVLYGTFLVHMAGTLGLAARFLGRVPYRDFLGGMRQPATVAFATSSSLATLPVTLRSAEERLGVREDVADFVIPLGATVNMDGSSINFALGAVFVAQVYGIDLSASHYLLIAVASVLGSIGAAGLPSTGMLFVVVFQMAGIPIEGVALLMGADRLCDMLRTSTNVTGDLVGSAVVSRLLGTPARPRRQQR